MNQEKLLKVGGGALALLVWIAALSGTIAAMLVLQTPVVAVMGGLAITALLFSLNGFFINQPNYATALTLFGDYKGTVKGDGWFFTNPFYTKRKVSLRAQTLNGVTLKVNDKVGNPVEIAAITVWRVRDSFRALFEVEDYFAFVQMQSEAALRHLATTYPYDAEDHETSLMRDPDVVNERLAQEIQEKLDRAGIEVLEARLSHLAYAEEIAGVMLRKQQAAAIIAARQRIVDGAVGMVQMALHRLDEEGIVAMEPERKAQMVSNLLVVLCGESNAQPVVNAGSVY